MVENMALHLTHGSAIEYENILYGNMTPEMAAAYLREGRICVRSFSDTLSQMYPSGDLLQRLLDFYMELEPGSRPASLKRKLKNWMTGRNHPLNREDFFRIAFVLGLSEAQLNYLLGMCTDYTIQYRHGREAVLAWFLRRGSCYQDAVCFLEQLPVCPAETILTAAAAMSGSADADISRITHEIHDEFSMAHTLDELRACYLRNMNRFGSMHLRSYYYFDQYLSRLIRPASYVDEEEPDYSIERIMETYLSLHMPAGKKRNDYSLVQKLIKHNWPSVTYLKNIRSQAADVPRKLLLLLYVVTENIGYRDDYLEMDEDYISLEERVEDHWWTLGAMLADCGMAGLDLRNAFDWLILYAISSDGEQPMKERLEGVINELFRDEV